MSYTTPAPTDEEIMELARPFISRVGSHWENDDAIPDNGRIEDFARAVLAKWGAQPATSPAPVVAREPVAWMDAERGEVVSAKWLASDEATADYRAVYTTPLYAEHGITSKEGGTNAE